MPHITFLKCEKTVNNHEQSGFSLVELMVVVGIIGILAAVAGNQYQAFAGKARRAVAVSVFDSLSKTIRTNLTNGESVPWNDEVDNSQISAYVNAAPAQKFFKFRITQFPDSGTLKFAPIFAAVSINEVDGKRDEIMAIPGFGILVCEDMNTGSKMSASQFATAMSDTGISSQIGQITDYGALKVHHTTFLRGECLDGNVSIP